MGQVGLHAIFGLGVGEYLVTPFVHDRVGRRAVMFGFVLGNIIPDLDFIAVISMYPVDQTLALHLHRGFTHSILAAVALLVGVWASSWLMQDRYLRYLGYGLALGVVGHFTKDLFLWFVPVDVFWPASIFGIIPMVDLWYWWSAPPLLGRVMAAAELAAFGLYYNYLIRSAVRLETNPEMLPTLRRFSTLCWFAWALLTALALDLPEATFEIYMYIPLGLIFMPSCLYLTWRMQNTIELLGIYGAARKK